MASNSSPAFPRLNPVDRRGRHIDPVVLAAAEEIFPRALEHGLKLLGDPARVADALEEVAATVSRLLTRQAAPGDPAPIRNLQGYVFRALIRRVNRLKRKEPVLLGINAMSQPFLTHRWSDPSRQFDMKILVDECLAQCDFTTRDMFWRRAQGFTWKEIGKVHGLSSHAAEVRFLHAVRGVRARLTNGRRSSPVHDGGRPDEELKPAVQANAEKPTTPI